MRTLFLPILCAGCASVVPGVVPPALTAPSLVHVTVVPADADILLDGVASVGETAVEGLTGAVTLRVSRRGYAPDERLLTVSPGEVLEQGVVLTPLEQAVTVQTTPPGAWLARADGVRLGQTPLTVQVPSGSVDWTVSLSGWRTESIHAEVDRPLTLARWLDAPGQLLDRQRIIATCPEPKAVLMHPTRPEVWVACLDGPPSVVAHNWQTGEVLAELTLGEHGAVELHFDAAAEHLYASQMETHLVYDIDLATREVVRVLNARSIWSKVLELSADGERLFVSNWLGDDVSELDLSSGALVRRLPTVVTPRGLYATEDGAALYAAGFDSGDLGRIDLRTGRSTTVWSGGKNLRHIVGDPARGVIYVSDMGRRAVFVHDIATGSTRKLADTSYNTNTIDLSADGEVLYVSNRGPNGSGGYLTVGAPGSVMAIDTRSGAILDTIAAGHQPTALDVQGDTLIFGDFRDDRLQVFRLPDTATLRAGAAARDAAASELLPPP